MKRIRTLEGKVDELEQLVRNLTNTLNETNLKNALLNQENRLIKKENKRLKEFLDIDYSAEEDSLSLKDVILYSFTRPELKRKLDETLDLNLDNIVSPTANMEETTYELLKWFERQGRTNDLRDAILS